MDLINNISRFNTVQHMKSFQRVLRLCVVALYRYCIILCICSIQEMLRIHDTVFWADASVRLLTSHLEKVFLQAANISCGLLMLWDGGTNIFSTTHERMYRYLPITKNKAINIRMGGAEAIFILRSKEV